MADHHLPGHAAGRRIIGDALDLPGTQFALVMQVNIHASAKFLRQIKDTAQLSIGIAVNARRIQPAHGLHPHLHGLPHQFGRAWAAQQPRLRECHELQINPAAPNLTQLHQSFDMFHTNIGRNVDMAANRYRAKGQHPFQKAPGAGGDRRGLRRQNPAFVVDITAQARP